jgi:hypothetical protein
MLKKHALKVFSRRPICHNTLYFLCSCSEICILHTSLSQSPLEISYLHVLRIEAEIDGILPEWRVGRDPVRNNYMICRRSCCISPSAILCFCIDIYSFHKPICHYKPILLFFLGRRWGIRSGASHPYDLHGGHAFGRSRFVDHSCSHRRHCTVFHFDMSRCSFVIW